MIAPNQCDSEKQFQCKTSGICVPKGWFCDGTPDCEDSSDEPASCGNVDCQKGFFKCDNKKCIFKSYVCDGEDDCGDGSDESEEHACRAREKPCPEGHWRCPGEHVSDVCVPMARVCDDRPDCPNGADEGPLCDGDDCGGNKAGCSNGCVQTPQGPLCTCPPGEVLHANDTRVCVNNNECDPPGVCSQVCKDLKPSGKGKESRGYYCECYKGYDLQSDKSSCKAANHSDAFLVISNRRTLLTSDLSEHSLERIPVDVENVVATASNMQDNVIYWSDMKLKKIMSLKRGAENGPQVVVGSGVDLVEGLAYDWVAKNLYWLDSRLNTIEVARANGTNRMILLSQNISQPRGLTLDPSEGSRWLFWTDWGENPRIERVGMDGTYRQVIIDTKIYWPNGLALDIPTKRVYFADSKLDFIDFCNYDGTGRQQVIANNHYLLHPHSLSVFEDQIYWTDRQLNRVLKARKFRGSNETIISQLVSQPLSVHVHHPVLQPVMANPCDGNQCDQLCLLAPNVGTNDKYRGFVCKCRPGFRLVDDKNCVEKDDPYLMVVKSSQIVDVSIKPEDDSTGHLTPIVDVKFGKSVDYDTKNQAIYWTEMENEKDINGTLYMSHIGGGDKINFFEEFDTGIVGSPYAIAFDWVGRNMYIANQESSTIELVRVDGKRKQRMVLLSSNGEETGVATPKAIALDPQVIAAAIFNLPSALY